MTYYDFYHVNCTNDDCVEHYDDGMVYHGTGAWYGSIADAIAAWNTRAATTIGKAQVEVEPVLRGTLTAEQMREAIFNGSGYASFDGAKYYADGIGMQAIADELNAALGNGECERTTTRNGKFKTKYGRKVPLCECCGYAIGDDRYNFCPKCGAKIVKAVKR